MPDYKVSAPGFEPGTVCLEGRCSIQLSYAPLCVKFSNFGWKMFTVIFKKTVIFQTVFLSGWQDSNLRPPGPKPGAMTGLRYTPKLTGCGGCGIRTHATLARRQFSKLLR